MPPKRQPRPWVKLHRAPIQGPAWGQFTDTQRAIWIECLTLARDDDFSGALPCESDIAWRFHRPTADVKSAVEALVDTQWIERTQTGLRVPNWRAWQEYTNTERSQDKRDRDASLPFATQCNAMQHNAPDCNNTESEAETEPETEGETHAGACEAPLPPDRQRRRKGNGNGAAGRAQLFWAAVLRQEWPEDGTGRKAFHEVNGAFLLSQVRQGKEKEPFAAQRFVEAYLATEGQTTGEGVE